VGRRVAFARFMRTPQGGNADVDDWSDPHMAAPAASAWALVGLTTGLLSVAAAVIGGWAAGPGGAGLAAALGVLGVGAALAIQRRLVLTAAGARPLRPGEAPRLVNLATGLAADSGVALPELMIASHPDPNALVWGGRRPVVAVSAGMVEGFARTELEAVVAHCLLRLRAPATRGLAPILLLSRLGLPRQVVSVGDDLRAAAFTRYPPALAAAIAKCSPKKSRAGAAYFVAEGASHSSVSERVIAVSDL
jgi:hypothetical protein